MTRSGGGLMLMELGAWSRGGENDYDGDFGLDGTMPVRTATPSWADADA